MPPSVLLGAFILGAILLLVALLGGAFELFNAKVLGSVGKIERVIAGIVGTILIIIALVNPFERSSNSFSPSPPTAVASTAFTPTVPSNTPVPLSATNTLSPPTNTPEPPTNTPVPPTNTLVPPTATPTPTEPPSSQTLERTVTRSEVSQWTKTGQVSREEVLDCLGQVHAGPRPFFSIREGDTIPDGSLVASNFSLGGKEWTDLPVIPICRLGSWGLFESTQAFPAPYEGAYWTIVP